MKLRKGLVSVLVLTTTALAACGQKLEATNPSTSAPEATVAPPAGVRTPHTINAGEPIDGEATLKAPAQVAAGATFEIDWSGPGNAADYVDIVPRGYTKTSGEITYVYAKDAVLVAELNAPVEPGEYDIRYLAELKDGRVVKATVPLTVTPVAVTLDAPPATATGGEPLSIKWTGPNYKGDYIDIVPRGFTKVSGEISYAYTSAGNPSVVVAPGAPGEYDIRYVAEGQPDRRVMTTSPLTVTASPASLVAPPSTRKGSSISVNWTGPNRQGDYVDLVPKGYSKTSGELAYFYTSTGPSGSLKAPDKAGDYEIRYVLEAPGGRRILATAPLKVE
jgi:Ca-activated chloride channel homolog